MTTKTTTVTLKKPIELGDNQITELTIRQPCAGDLRGVSLYSFLQGDVDAMSTVFPRIITPTITPAHVNTIPMNDLTTIQSAVIGFLGD